MNIQPSTAVLLGRHGLDGRFGYKVKRAGEDRCFFRFLDGRWHDVKAPHDFGYTEEQAVEILQLELATAEVRAELMVFGCCCWVCGNSAELKAAVRHLADEGFNVSHGHWPEHEQAELDRIDREMAANIQCGGDHGNENCQAT